MESPEPCGSKGVKTGKTDKPLCDHALGVEINKNFSAWGDERAKSNSKNLIELPIEINCPMRIIMGILELM